MTDWGDLFDRAAAVSADVAAVSETLTNRRERRAAATDESAGHGTDEYDDPPGEAVPTRVVADADVLAADLLVGGAAREAVDAVREHSWVTLLASDELLADAVGVVETLAASSLGPDRAASLVADWQERAASECVPVRHPPGDHPGLSSAYRGGAAHLLTFDDGLTTARAGLSVQPHAALSTRRPEAFAAVFDAAALYETTVGGTYPGPDRDPRE